MTKALTNFDALADLHGLPRPETTQAKIDNLLALVNRLVVHTQTEASGESMGTWEQYAQEYMSIYNAIVAHAQELARPSAPTAVEPVVKDSLTTAKPLFGELIAQHPGLREEIAAELVEQDERAAFEAWCALDNPRYHPTDDNPLNRRDWKVWQAARASKGTP